MNDASVTFLQIALWLLLGKSAMPLHVNSLDDSVNPPMGTVTLRQALRNARNGDIITFDESLDGGTVNLTIVGEEHSILQGEVMEFSGGTSHLIGFFDRDYGASALYTKKSITLDASRLSNGITLRWAGGRSNPARVLGVYGDLTLKNIRITGGYSVAQDISVINDSQPWTLARGCGVAVWGKLTIVGNEIYDNHCVGDFGESRDRGAFGGGVYANLLDIQHSVISGNTVTGAGAAGGGVYSVGGPGLPNAVSRIQNTTISGNRISAIFTYGGGVYSDGGSIGSLNSLQISNSTIARNLVEPVVLPDHLRSLYSIGYWRGGGVYMSNGYLEINSSTIVQNKVYGYPRMDERNKPNLAGGIAATIGNAHAAEEMVVGHSLICGNTVTELDQSGVQLSETPGDIFTGSLLHFKSSGYNLIGTIDFSQILVPVGERNWWSLTRKHFSMQGDSTNISLDDVLDLQNGITFSPNIFSTGVSSGNPAVLYYMPRGASIDQIPINYMIDNIFYEYEVDEGGEDDFLTILLKRVENHFSLKDFAVSFQTDFELYLASVDTDSSTPGKQPYTDPDGSAILKLKNTHWFGPAVTWPSMSENFAYIDFFHKLDNWLENTSIVGMGPELLGQNEWLELFTPGPLTENTDISILQDVQTISVRLPSSDQLSTLRPFNSLGDIGAIEAH